MKNTTKLIESYNVNEEFLYNNTYLFIKGFATGLRLNYTLKALPLARKFHDGQHRKGEVEVNGKMYRLPYVLHVLKVCSTLISLSLDTTLTHFELDTLLAAALLHDSIEDASQYLPNDGKELVTEYNFPNEVYQIVKLLTKRSGSTEEELDEYFNKIKKNPLAILIKLSDRSHNVEDLYNMKPEKLHEYVKETRTWIYPLASYGKANFPELSNGFTILKSKIVSLTELTETIVNMYDNVIHEKDNKIAELEAKLNGKKEE